MAEHDLETSIQNWSTLLTRLSIHKIHKTLKEKKISITQMNTLGYIFHHENTSVSELGELLAISTAAASQLLEKMVQMDLVERKEDKQDRRLKHLSVTRTGKNLMKEIKCLSHDWTHDFVQTIPPDEAEQYGVVLNDLHERILDFMKIEEHK